MVDQKKRLLSRYSEELVLKDRLYEVEQEAAMLVNQHAMTNPPASLVAAIVPAASSKSVVGAWSGSKPFKEGGGAPCPSDFLLPRQERREQEHEGEDGDAT